MNKRNDNGNRDGFWKEYHYNVNSDWYLCFYKDDKLNGYEESYNKKMVFEKTYYII